MICVYDTGIGIDQAHLGDIFEPYYQVQGSGRREAVGIGLGLSIVSRITQMLSLEQIVRSKPGVGSLFAVLVPYGTSSGGMQRDQESALASPNKQGARSPLVVIIDDSADTLVGMSALLEKWGCKSIAVATPTDALVQLISADLQPDLVISDYHLAAGVKGDTAIAQISREFDQAPMALIMTSDPDPALRKRLQDNALPVLDKPLNVAMLRALIERLKS